MAERTDAQHHGHLLGLAHLKELAQRALTVPAEHALLFLDMVPEHVGGDDGHTALLHFAHLLPPFVLRKARIVNFAHDGADAPTINDETRGIPRHTGHIG